MYGQYGLRCLIYQRHEEMRPLVTHGHCAPADLATLRSKCIFLSSSLRRLSFPSSVRGLSDDPRSSFSLSEGDLGRLRGVGGGLMGQ